jgi:hypothetical protein
VVAWAVAQIVCYSFCYFVRIVFLNESSDFLAVGGQSLPFNDPMFQSILNNPQLMNTVMSSMGSGGGFGGLGGNGMNLIRLYYIFFFL